MDKKKLLIAAASVGICAVTLAVGGTSPATALTAAVGAARTTAYLSAGITVNSVAAPRAAEEAPPSEEALTGEESFTESRNSTAEAVGTVERAPTVEAAPGAETHESVPAAQTEGTARVISRNITEFDDGTDRTAAGNKSGIIVREHFAGYQGNDYITLPGGGIVWNCTSDSAEKILAAGSSLPELPIEKNTPEPQVLIVHTHTTEGYEPYQRDYYDSSYPSRTRDPSHNMIAVGEALADKLAENGISVLHDGTVHDYPSYTGSYDRSEATIRAALEEYPSIKVIIDLHRDAIANDGVRTAPVATVDGRSAAQFMIITGCDDGRFGNMPDYLSNLSLACLIQDTSEKLYPGLARPVLFDYRNYNQHISTGSLLIEVGSHANSLDEAVYTGELLGEILSDSLSKLAAPAGNSDVPEVS